MSDPVRAGGGYGEGDDGGSTIPLILGLVLIALLVVAGSIAAGDAFVAQSQLQDLCDGAAVAAASAADLDGGRHLGDGGDRLVLGTVQNAVDQYLDRDAARRDVMMSASLSADDVTVTVQCAQTRAVVFGAWFGFADGIEHHASSTAQGRLRT